jgi:hypothetical protein
MGFLQLALSPVLQDMLHDTGFQVSFLVLGGLAVGSGVLLHGLWCFSPPPRVGELEL